MGKLSFSFPQISRFFSATFFLLLWASLGLALAINGLGKLNEAQTSLPYLGILQKPLSWKPHMEAAQELWAQGSQREAKHEAALAQDLALGATVLGTSVSPTELLTQWETQPIQLESQFEHWKTVALQRPDYRDAFVMAAVYGYQLGKKQEAIELITHALALDPASASVQELHSLMTDK